MGRDGVGSVESSSRNFYSFTILNPHSFAFGHREVDNYSILNTPVLDYAFQAAEVGQEGAVCHAGGKWQ